MGLLEIAQEKQNIYIYGECERSYQIINFLEKHGLEVKGITISCGYPKRKEFDKPIYYINEINRTEEIFFVVGLKYRWINELVSNFVEYNIKDVYFLTGEDLLELQSYDDFYHKANNDVDKIYFDWRSSVSSAKEIFGYMLELLHIETVIDVGCGCGAWLKGVKDLKPSIKVMGIDNSDCDRSEFLAPNEFVKCDVFSFNPPKKYDVAISLEVAEHIDQNKADDFIEKLCECSQIILFSAAIKYQGGNHHVNEQFQDYWKEKFERYGYICIDLFRQRFWNNDNVSVYFKQNMFLYVDKEKKDLFDDGHVFFENAIHPKLWEDKMSNFLKGLF